MELIVKLYTDKPSRIGIVYPLEHAAVKSYESLLASCPRRQADLTIELLHNKLEITISSAHTGAQTIYRQLSFKKEQIERLRQFDFGKQPMLLVHVFPKHNVYTIARPHHSSIFLEVNRCSFLGILAVG